MEAGEILKKQQEHTQRAQKSVRLVEFLSRIAQFRTKLTRDIADYEKKLWISEIPHEQGCFTQAWGSEEEHEQDEWVEVQTRREPELPIVPNECEEWIDYSSLRNKEEPPELYPQIMRQIPNPDWYEGSEQPETIPYTEKIEDHPEIQKKWDYYLETKWLPWIDEHGAWEKVQRAYSELFAIHQLQIRLGEEYELVLGLGLLSWQTPNKQRVRRHLIVADVVLEFEAHLGKFTIRPHPEGAKLRPELDMLDIEEQPAGAEETAKASLVGAEDNPWEKGSVEGVLKALVHSISPHGEYDASLKGQHIRASAKPVVEFAPALILRKRSARGLTETLNRIKEQINNGGTIPYEFAELAEIGPNDNHDSSPETEGVNDIFDGEIFFPKPSNDEQRRIVDKIRSANGILVQGPPGTGKSHTIANLICHLLATGQRTLITAKTPRALRVLERLVPEELRPLCINLFGAGTEERRSLESSVGGILRKSEEWDEEQPKRKREELETRLRELREEKAKVNRRLRDIRESETHTHSIAGGAYQGTAARIAEAVNRDRSEYGWFIDSVPLDTTCQITVNDFQRVLEALRLFTPEKRQELDLVWPNTLPTPEHFADLVSKEISAVEEEQTVAYGVDERVVELLARNNTQIIEAIHEVFSRVRDTHRKLLATPQSWMNEALRDILGGNSQMWNELFRVTHEIIESIEKLVAFADETQVGLTDQTDIRSLYEDTLKLKEHLENGGKLGWGLFRSNVVKERLYLIKNVFVNGRPCTTIEQLSALAEVLYVRIEIEKAWGFWKGRSDKIEGPYSLQLSALKSLHDTLKNALELEELIAKGREAMSKCPNLGEPVWSDADQIEMIISSCSLALARTRHRRATEEIDSVAMPISRLVANGDAHPVNIDLLNTIKERDVDGFTHCVSTIHELTNQQQQLQKIDEYILMLRSVLPQLIKSLEETCSEPYWDERVQHIVEAWNWAQARYWIEEYIRQDDIPWLAKRAKQIEDEINTSIAKLAALYAWSYCFSRLQEGHRRHMEAWQQSMRRFGKGTGKHAPRHRREAQGHLNKCREAVPAWVMPLHRVWDTVSPEPGMFDVIIVDEASQCGLEALPLFYLAKKILIVGDDKQISPDAVGLRREAVHSLVENFLYDFQFKSSFDVESSLFDHGKVRYGTQRIPLREHFRCMPEIIRFSNTLCYSDTPLIPLRQYGPDRLPPLEHVFVRGGYREGSNNRMINRPEAEAIVARIVELCGESRYDGKTLGVVVLQGDAQAALIENQLLERLGAEEMENRRLVCGNPYSFQGDERDIIFLSLVAANNARIGTLTRSADERRFNVAASRARDMMVLFHSVTPEDLSASCLRRQLLEFFENTEPQQIAGIGKDELERRAAQDNRRLVNPPKPFDSWFEVDVALELLRKEFFVFAQHEVAGKQIDLVVEGGQTRMAVECDGDHWHGADRHEADMQRQRQLERCGWEFFRIRESAFYTNKGKVLNRLLESLEERGIFPGSQNGETYSENDSEKEIFEKDTSSVVNEEENDVQRFYFSENSKSFFEHSGSRVDEITSSEIQEAIIAVLSNCPNKSCTQESLTSRVLKAFGVLTRGKPRQEFHKRVMQSVDILERRESIEKYKAKNDRIRIFK